MGDSTQFHFKQHKQRPVVLKLHDMNANILLNGIKTALVLKRSCNVSREKSNELTDQEDMFYYIISANLM